MFTQQHPGPQVTTAPTWFQITTRPASRLTATVFVFALFIAGVVLGVQIPGYHLWFEVPAVVVLAGWYLVMRRIHLRMRAQ